MSQQYRSCDQASAPVTKILELLTDLKSSPSGAILFQHIEQMLGDWDVRHAEVERAYAGFVRMLLEAAMSHVAADAALLTHMQLLQRRLTPPLSPTEVGALSQATEFVADQLTRMTGADQRRFEAALSPLLRAFSPKTNSVGVTSSDPVGMKPMADDTVVSSAASGTSQVDPDDLPVYVSSHGSPREQINVEQRVNSAYRSHLDERRKEMDKLQIEFVERMKEAVSQSEVFSDHISTELETLQNATNINDVEQRRKVVVNSLQTLLHGHKALTQKLDNAEQLLSFIEDDHQKLSSELDRVRLLSLTDELTGLPNRRAFMRRLEDEVSRVQRYGYPLSLVLLDLDYFKAINDKYGHPGGDAVLKVYATKILSIFRHHDMVARYGGEEFAVLMPNTDIQGVECALRKVQRRVSEIVISLDEQSVPAPTFSAGVAEYRPGETPGKLIERADNALYRAKQTGRGRVEISSPEVADAAVSPFGRQVPRS